MTEFGDRLRKYLKKGGISYDSFAEKLEVSHGAVSAWVNGKYPPRADNLRRISDITGWDFDELMTEARGWEAKPAQPGALSPARRRLLALVDGRSEKDIENVILALDMFLNGLGKG